MADPNFSTGEPSSVKSPNFSIGETTSDLDLFGKRKRGNDIKEIDSGMAKEAKKTKEVLEFTDFFGLLSIYKKKMIFEKEDFDPMVDYVASDDDEEDINDMKEHPYDREAVLKYISQVRNSGGFDVDVHIPGWLHAGLVNFFPNMMSYPNQRDFIYKLAQVAIDEIKKSKSFELVEVVKAVSSNPCYGLVYLTLAVKKDGGEGEEAATIQAIVNCHWDSPLELKEWRVKPEVEA
ncbi:hypothetical protein SASPL_137249 [Salvia splendens]|uniref:Cystatin domain-containing protein n=1 Tax=Salvia splendens TaxID=180675 RepID=A0A8X8WSJ3_SALSN|nr:uncharacterized protein LOC121763431 [Salvia splendens]KAG6400418.1 hypothetical protein SASPL_137249 [Salvia splendens]